MVALQPYYFQVLHFTLLRVSYCDDEHPLAEIKISDAIITSHLHISYLLIVTFTQNHLNVELLA